MKVHAIFGPPGTGKTTALIKHAGRLDERILFLSFTKSAAAEATGRLPKGSTAAASTIHSLAFQMLNLSRAQVVDEPKLLDFSDKTGIPFKGSEEGSEDPQDGDLYLQAYSFSQNRMCGLDEAYERFGAPGKRAEWEAYRRQVTPQELKRYLSL